VSWLQDPNRVRQLLSGRHLGILQGTAQLGLATVSGVLSTKTALVEYVDRNLPAFSVVTTKSFQVVPNPGNREPIICEPSPGSFGNSVGLKNPGMEVALAELKALRGRLDMRTLLNVSVSASTVEDFITLVGAFEPVADIIELNFSCPHASAGYGASIGCSAEISGLYMSEIRKTFPHCGALIFPKLTPNVPDIAIIAKEVMDAGADGIVAINTVGPEVHVEPISGKPILQNKLGGKGGKSGLWVRDEALACIGAIRKAVGDSVPIIGMGGVSTGTDVAQMVRAGADVVGVGSAFGKVHQRDWRSYSDALASDATMVLKGNVDPDTARTWYRKESSMEYARHTIIGRTTHGEDTVVITLDGSWEYEAGQFVFLWLPQVGEKPFSIAEANPFTFVIKRRGAFTNALYDLRVGDPLYVRGLYGAPVVPDLTKRAILVAGGTGVAVLPALAKRLHDQGTEMEIYVGTSESVADGRLFEENLSPYGKVTIVADEGIPGRVLQQVRSALQSEVQDLSCYVVGPSVFMRIAADYMLDAGIRADRIHLSLELNTLCGIGMCGECLCGERLTCAWGTFIDYGYIRREAPGLL
jgi:dihydroorotate dehydrogenase (NAD+) catalytic subunit